MPQDNFWTSLATYCQELAPVAGPLLASVGETADAIDRAKRPRLPATTRPKRLRSTKPSQLTTLLATEDDYE